MEDYIPNNATKEQLTQIRQQMWQNFWSDKQKLTDHYFECRQQIHKHLDKVKKKRRKNKKTKKKKNTKH